VLLLAGPVYEDTTDQLFLMILIICSIHEDKYYALFSVLKLTIVTFDV